MAGEPKWSIIPSQEPPPHQETIIVHTNFAFLSSSFRIDGSSPTKHILHRYTY